MPKKVNKPTLTPNQSKWIREYKQLDTIIKRAKKKYPDIEIPEPPKKPQRITEKSITKLTTYKEELESKISTPKTPKTTTPKTPKTTSPKTLKTTSPKTPKTTSPKTPKTTSPKTPKTTSPKTPKTTSPKTPKTTTPKTPKTSIPKKSKQTKELPNERDYIDSVVLDYLRMAIENVSNRSFQDDTLKYDRLKNLKIINHIVGDIPDDILYERLHNNVQLIIQHIDIICYSSNQDDINASATEIISIIADGILSVEQAKEIDDAVWDFTGTYSYVYMKIEESKKENNG